MYWTPMYKEFPPMGVPLMVTVDRKIHEGPRKVVLGPVYRMQETKSGEIGFFEYASEDRRIGPEYFQVVAWAEWPIPWTGDDT